MTTETRMSDPDMDTATAQRLAKWIARAGICSRREAERLIADGRVDVDGEAPNGPGMTVDDPSRITVDGEPLPPLEPTRLFRFHKSPGTLVTERGDPDGRPTIYDRLPGTLPRVVPVGRLDLNTEGLLLLTNDGELKRRLELPATGWIRRYRARVYGNVDEAALAKLAQGITVDGVAYGGIHATLDQRTGANAWLTLALREGKNREVRRVLEHLGLRVSRLIRTSYGPFQLGSLKPDRVAEVAPKVLAEQLGLPMPADAHVGAAKPKAKPTKPNAHRRRTA
jgi:23S rRNA pseudouridine2605 synthase